MYRLRQMTILLMLSLFAGSALAQANKAAAKDVDPLALDVLRAVTQPIEQAKALSFKALVSEEEVATNGQIVTFFHTVAVTLQRPDKVHLTFKGRGQLVEYYASNGTITMYAPDVSLYTTIPGKSTIDAALDDMNARDVDFPIGPFLRDDGYKRAAANVTTGYVIGRVKIFDQDVHQLAFSAPDADWQLWVTGGENPRILRAEIVNKNLEGKPRTIIQFLDWDLNATPSADEFSFNKPAGAQQIDVLPEMGGK